MAFSGKIGVFLRFSGFFGVLMQSILANSMFFGRFPAKSTIFRRFWHLNVMYNYCKQQVRCQGRIFFVKIGIFKAFSGKIGVFWRFSGFFGVLMQSFLAKKTTPNAFKSLSNIILFYREYIRQRFRGNRSQYFGQTLKLKIVDL